MKLSQYTLDLLADIEERIDPEVEEDFLAQWRKFWNDEVTEVEFTPKRKAFYPSRMDVKEININDALDDYERMLDAQLADVSRVLSHGLTSAMGMRSNYGTGIMTSLFGAEIFKMPYETNTLPTTRSLNDTEKIRRIVEKGAPDLDAGFGRDVFCFGEMCKEILRDYPKISKYVYMYHPDTQGPLDVAELLWGGEMFYAFYDEPELVHGMMQLITDTYVRFLDRWFELYPAQGELSVHWDYWIKGGICLRNDSAINLSPEQYTEFVLPYDKYLLDYYNGGSVHYCGKGDHFVGIVASQTKVTGFDISQPHLNDMEKVFDAVFSSGKKLVNMASVYCDQYAKRPDHLPGMIFGR